MLFLSHNYSSLHLYLYISKYLFYHLYTLTYYFSLLSLFTLLLLQVSCGASVSSLSLSLFSILFSSLSLLHPSLPDSKYILNADKFVVCWTHPSKDETELSLELDLRSSQSHKRTLRFFTAGNAENLVIMGVPETVRFAVCCLLHIMFLDCYLLFLLSHSLIPSISLFLLSFSFLLLLSLSHPLHTCLSFPSPSDRSLFPILTSQIQFFNFPQHSFLHPHSSPSFSLLVLQPPSTHHSSWFPRLPIHHHLPLFLPSQIL